MNTAIASSPPRQPTDWSADAMQRRIRARYRAEKRFRFYGLFAVLLSAGFLAFLLVTMISSGARGFTQTQIALPVNFAASDIFLEPGQLEGDGRDQLLAQADFQGLARQSAITTYGEEGPGLLSNGAWVLLRDAVSADPSLLTRNETLWVPASTEVDFAARGDSGSRQSEARDVMILRYAELEASEQVRRTLSWNFLTLADSSDPTLVGIWGALKGSLLTMTITLLLAFPIGVLTAVYLEEYAPENRWTDIIEVSINNLAAVPSIIFGLLGLAVFINVFHLPRSAAIVGGLTLALMTMPVIVIAGRNAIKSVPPSIRDAALGIGASPVQVLTHHVLPLSLPGILTGTIIGMSRALGETAPLLLIGMRAFVATPPGGFTDPATVLPVQIFLWSDELDPGFVEKTSAAIIVLLLFLLAMNGIAIWLRNKYEQRW
ncbi:phosphate ABC transporter permease PstA [Parasphingopyxis lamellibrachiae]|uniref:Phosphate transport system permease protein PstA n=1 Tax=Parasphingopyxis lamellibrachiae TaxID=680125 RepID=A0A3D9FBX2_9SPHN|nr:phosphate ABC transporter permease PstA [Parasphingopyxis lamellibrachiae]RED15122.1 phosphate ABC transporter membrane protein 2 (PhoT family) [Parasphingopyxis lamellibrachiae]